MALAILPAPPAGVQAFDLDPQLDGYTKLPIPDAKSQLYLGGDGRVYSFRREMNAETGHREVGLFCAADRYFVSVSGGKAVERICMGHPGDPCEHIPTENMHIFHRALRAVKLLCCDFMERGLISAGLKKVEVVAAIDLVFGIYGPEYPAYNRDELCNHRLSGWKFLRACKKVPRIPWAAIRAEDEPVLAEEMVRERARGPNFDLALQAMVERFPLDPEGPPERRVNRGINDNLPELAAVITSVQALARAVGTPAVKITIDYQGPRTGHRQSRHPIPRE
jgi:hypothetical protein